MSDGLKDNARKIDLEFLAAEFDINISALENKIDSLHDKIEKITNGLIKKNIIKNE